LNLSDTQRDKINSIVSEYRDRLTLERQEADRAEQDFENVVNADTVERRRGWTAVEQLVKARGVFTKDMAEFTLRLRAVLTADQWRILREREGERRFNDGKGPRPDGGRGRRGGPPPAVPSSTSPAH
jgi:Spy/CpxP family protein refolding chaperone